MRQARWWGKDAERAFVKTLKVLLAQVVLKEQECLTGGCHGTPRVTLHKISSKVGANGRPSDSWSPVIHINNLVPDLGAHSPLLSLLTSALCLGIPGEHLTMRLPSFVMMESWGFVSKPGAGVQS